MKRDWTEEQKEEWKNSGEQEKRDEEREIAAQAIAHEVSNLKRVVLGAPMESCMMACMEEKLTFKACQIDYRPDESFWVFQSDKDAITVYFQLNFHTKMEQELANVLCIELKNTRQCKPGVSIEYFP